MGVATGDNESDLIERTIKVENLTTKTRGGHEALIVEDSAGNKYSTINEDVREEAIDDKGKYVGKAWDILFTVTREGFLNFYYFLEESSVEPIEDEIDPADYEVTQGLDERGKRITRQSAGHDAARIVQGMIESNTRYFSHPDTGSFKEEVKDELQEWSEFFKKQYRTGEWGESR